MSIQNPNAAPGVIRPGSYNVVIVDVPDNVTAADVLTVYKQTAVWRPSDTSYIVRYDQLGQGKILIEKNDLVGHAEAAEILGWDKRRISTYIQRGSFPEPVIRLSSGPIWTRQQIEEYRDARK